MRLCIAEGRINKTSDSAAQSLNAELQAGREYNMISTLLDIRRFLLEVKVKVKKCSCWKDVLQWSGQCHLQCVSQGQECYGFFGLYGGMNSELVSKDKEFIMNSSSAPSSFCSFLCVLPHCLSIHSVLSDKKSCCRLSTAQPVNCLAQSSGKQLSSICGSRVCAHGLLFIFH